MSTKTRILLVDDEPQVVRAMERILRAHRRDWVVRSATSAQTALGMLAEEPADVVVSDMRMPGIDGAAFLDKVKQSYPTAVRIVLSGYGTEEAADRVARVSDRVLAKPITTASLLDTLQSAVDALCPAIAPA